MNVQVPFCMTVVCEDSDPTGIQRWTVLKFV
jgi:hypothetical protein